MNELTEGKILRLNKKNFKGAKVITLPIKIIRNNTTIIKLNNNPDYNDIPKGRNATQEHSNMLRRTYTNPESLIQNSFEEKVIKLNYLTIQKNKQNKKNIKKYPQPSIYKKKVVNDKYPSFSNHSQLNIGNVNENENSYAFHTSPSLSTQDDEITFREQNCHSSSTKLSGVNRPVCIFNFQRKKRMDLKNKFQDKEKKEIEFSPVKFRNGLRMNGNLFDCNRGDINKNKYDLSFDFWKRKKNESTI